MTMTMIMIVWYIYGNNEDCVGLVSMIMMMTSMMVLVRFLL